MALRSALPVHRRSRTAILRLTEVLERFSPQTTLPLSAAGLMRERQPARIVELYLVKAHTPNRHIPLCCESKRQILTRDPSATRGASSVVWRLDSAGSDVYMLSACRGGFANRAGVDLQVP